MKNKGTLVIAGTEIAMGEEKEIALPLVSLPTGIIETGLTIFRSKKPGPVLLLTGGLHGDEINGIEIVRRIIAEKHYRCQAGTTICLPVVNIYGFLNYSRELPDGKDINRSFPGSQEGSLASRIACFLLNEILPFVDFGIDFHSGSNGRSNYPQVRVVMKDKKAIEMAKAFGAPFIVNADFRENSFREAASKQGKCILVYEGGELNRLNPFAITEAIKGTNRIMHYLGMKNKVPKAHKTLCIVQEYSWLRAEVPGIFEPTVRYGQLIKEGEVLGKISNPFGKGQHLISAPYDGYVIGLSNHPVATTGDALFNIGKAYNNEVC